jgi:hypothetical protein
MTTDLHNAFYSKVASNPRLAGIAPVGDAFQRAVNQGFAKGSGFYKTDGTFDESVAAPINLWWLDRMHPSKYGSYLSALVLFQTITGRNPLSFGANEQAAADLGIAPDVAVRLQRIAQETVAPDTVSPTTVPSANPPANGDGLNNTSVTVLLTATDNAGGSGVKQIKFATTGAQTTFGIVQGSQASIVITANGTTKIQFSATDNAGNTEPPRALTVTINRTST